MPARGWTSRGNSATTVVASWRHYEALFEKVDARRGLDAVAGAKPAGMCAVGEDVTQVVEEPRRPARREVRTRA